ncbi:4-hydroxy-tetrahydrodipicolinate synthase [Demequina sp. TTPB684]|uniref:4-hydroxy-tetrahydrodipicolinate synthase n=1 Tax=unclassified Demequina TaxID=2620311 RepID=UPI001CF39BC9|nr:MULTISPECIES: 4-hydroxy-tetrahydrodipicolinate synthase [unclassified Demequina]MCB2413718.1 4-hydroxy-tetrahydrodipicolinate synthase [Demequina sp. TTPB684]UPU89609.1 4-hydroxy-tetrahydrodipicolinate synthase [Demequina sp. TMPB413]
MTTPFGTVLTAMVTPMHDGGAIDLASSQRLAKYLVSRGCDGLVLSGTTGEAPTTHAPEKVDLLRAVREAVGPDITILTGAGSNDTAHAVRMAEQGEENGADGILALTPYYSKPTQAGVVAHIRAILGATSLPVMIYDIPGRTAVAMSDWALDELSGHDRVVAVKDATGNANAAKERIERSGLAWYSGDDPLTLDFLRAGAVGVVSVSSHIASREIAAMIAAFNAGDTAEAERIHEALLPVHAAIFNGPGATHAKSAMHWAGVIPSRAMRLPLLPDSDAEYVALTVALEAAGMTP